MKRKNIFLTHNQRIGIICLLLLLSLIFAGLHFLPPPTTEQAPTCDTSKIKNNIIHRQKSYYDSLHKVRSAYYDSLRLARRDSLYQIYQAHRDSTHKVDSLWWDSVKHISTPRIEKKDTILSLNTTDTAELKLIRGIGSGMARRIVHYRDQLGGFTRVEQLLDDQLYQDQYGHSIRSKYCLNDSIFKYFTIELDSIRVIPINHASVERLQAHPYISHSLAKEIYTLRRQKVSIKNSDELLVLSHMSDSLLQLLSPYLSFQP